MEPEVMLFYSRIMDAANDMRLKITNLQQAIKTRDDCIVSLQEQCAMYVLLLAPIHR